MFWHQRWRTLSARIDGLRQAGEYIATALPRAPGDSFGIVRKWLAKELREIVDELQKLSELPTLGLPSDARVALDRILQRDWFTDRPEQINENIVAVGALVTFRSSFEYLIQDQETDSRNRTELAFEHLRRMILVDEDVRMKWLSRYEDDGEPGCEKLGALHLLSHGILAFKIAGQRSITDLAFNEPLDTDAPIIKQAARALVLTEWKVAKQASDVQRKADEAKTQIREYQSGGLADTELTRTRYIVIVSADHIKPPSNVSENGITYRHIALSLKALTPSQVAARSPKRRRPSPAPKSSKGSRVKAANNRG